MLLVIKNAIHYLTKNYPRMVPHQIEKREMSQAIALVAITFCNNGGSVMGFVQ